MKTKSPGLLSAHSPSPSTALESLIYEFDEGSEVTVVPPMTNVSTKRARSPSFNPPRSHRRRTSDHSNLQRTAVGLRSLAKKIGDVKVSFGDKPPMKILVVAKLGDTSMNQTICDAVSSMIGNGKRVYLQQSIYDQLHENQTDDLKRLKSKSDLKESLTLWELNHFELVSNDIELIITLGGDGTVLFAAWLFQKQVPPIMPFNGGSLGFLTVFETEHFSDIMESNLGIGEQGLRMNLRMRFACTILRQDTSKEDHNVTYQVLNDLVVDRGPSPFLSSLELFGNDSHLTTVQADGLVISTPTGSTAYSLSAGGSVVHSDVSAILVTPICPHSLSFRPMILPDTMDIRILVPVDSRSSAWVSFDGRKRVHLEAGDSIHITSSPFPVPTVCKVSQSQDWFEGLERCLAWNKRSRQKAH